jgi:hypothetical protein
MIELSACTKSGKSTVKYMLSMIFRSDFGAVKSDLAHHFFGNACTKSGPLRFFHFSVVDWFCLFAYIYEYCLFLWKIARRSVILLLPLFGTVITVWNLLVSLHQTWNIYQNKLPFKKTCRQKKWNKMDFKKGMI